MAERDKQYPLLADEDLLSLAEAGDAGAFAALSTTATARRPTR
jgi:hypothetical protein